jgi:hypothetical protein
MRRNRPVGWHQPYGEPEKEVDHEMAHELMLRAVNAKTKQEFLRYAADWVSEYQLSNFSHEYLVNNNNKAARMANKKFKEVLSAYSPGDDTPWKKHKAKKTVVKQEPPAPPRVRTNSSKTNSSHSRVTVKREYRPMDDPSPHVVQRVITSAPPPLQIPKPNPTATKNTAKRTGTPVTSRASSPTGSRKEVCFQKADGTSVRFAASRSRAWCNDNATGTSKATSAPNKRKASGPAKAATPKRRKVSSNKEVCFDKADGTPVRFAASRSRAWCNDK